MHAGRDRRTGSASSARSYLKDPTDPDFKNDAGMNQWRAFMAKYMPGGDMTDQLWCSVTAITLTMLQVLKQCNGDFSRAERHAASGEPA